MPIDYRDYHPDWKNIRRQILDQAGHKCEFCGVPNKAIGARDRFGDWHSDDEIDRMKSDTGFYLFGDDPALPIRIVLTIAHLNHDVADNEPSNLRALCQKCHLNWDKDHHAANAARTRRQRVIERGQMPLLEIA